ncbi:MAG: transglycosylase SLT domain-containing protein [Bacteroidetes bacterium]|nr:transglycosylase SLT domain-containing protein [Bacteroidota bacterium]MBU1371833.1 transglycosylase SLT domain-containing protein [Bacteroidota bacterium]MBU1483282.1 transglycosylase SLT domain-containing protein [Bacteroidota bacterium]MBU1761067.1 transglycosylase SLT domain-containing protein [Bacteroidota bacterium]MBU2374713.1 transglycosylase SLT domain-containing protein [Bacteroidota bacterium]
MKRLIVFIYCTFLTFNLTLYAQTKIKIDSAKTGKLTLKESKMILNLIKSDSIKLPTNTALQREIYRLNPDLIYKYRLDSISSEVSLDYNEDVQNQINLYLAKKKVNIGKMVYLGKYYFPIFEKALLAYRVPLEFKYLPIVESSMNPFAVSRVGATGLWQFMYTTGKVYGLAIDNYVDERRDPVAASYAAAAYIRQAYNDLGDWLLALASYNCGKGNVTRAIERAGGGKKTFWDIQSYLPRETRSYVPAFIAANYMMNYYTRYDDIIVADDVPVKPDSIYINSYVSLSKIASAININATDLKNLNPMYKKDLINGSVSAPKKLIIPKVTSRNYPELFAALNDTDESTINVINASLTSPKIIKEKATYHTVNNGENLGKIALQFKVEVQDLKVWNQLKSNVIVPGQKLIIKPESVKSTQSEKIKKTDYITYKVKAGDSLSGIVERFENISIEGLKTLNNLKSNVLSIGMILKIYTN